LNLTWEVRDGIRCHTGKTLPSTLEGQIVRFADKIAYINHDIEDSIRGGVITESDIPRECSKILGDTSSKRINNMIVNIIQNSNDGKGIRMSPDFQEAALELRNFMFNNVYNKGSIAKRDEAKAERMIEELFMYLKDNPELLPEDFREYIENDGVEQVVLDYIAGMTDRYAIKKFQEIFVPASWFE